VQKLELDIFGTDLLFRLGNSSQNAHNTQREREREREKETCSAHCGHQSGGGGVCKSRLGGSNILGYRTNSPLEKLASYM